MLQSLVCFKIDCIFCSIVAQAALYIVFVLVLFLSALVVVSRKSLATHARRNYFGRRYFGSWSPFRHWSFCCGAQKTFVSVFPRDFYSEQVFLLDNSNWQFWKSFCWVASLQLVNMKKISIATIKLRIAPFYGENFQQKKQKFGLQRLKINLSP